MLYTITPLKRCSVLKISGRIDGSTSPKLEEGLHEIMDKGMHNIIIDMSEVEFMSSAGWWVLIEAQKECKKGSKGETVLVGVAEKIRTSLNLVGMDTYFKMFAEQTEAVGSF